MRKLLDNLPGDPSAQMEEFVLEPLHWNHYELGTKLQRFANQVDGITIIPQFLAF